jgi:hypothetical protein
VTAPLTTIVITGVEEARRKLDRARWWDALMRIAPRSLLPTAAKLKGRAPVGETGKLSRGFDVRAKRISQGFIQGVQAEIGARVGYGHLVARGHKIVARGATRFTFGGTARTRIASRALLGTERSKLKARRAGPAIGFVPPDPFAVASMAEDRAQIVRLIEKLLEQEVARGP